MKQMIAACTRLGRPARRLCLLLLAGLLLMACREAEAFLQFAQVDPNGWTRETGYVFTVDSLPATQDYPLSVMLRKSSDKAYPFRSITLVVHQRWTLPVPDAAAQARADARRHFTAIGQPRPPRCMRDSLLMVRNDTLVVILNEDDSPYCAIESNVGYFGVKFLREDLGNFLTYTFRDFTQEGKTLFLDTIRLQPKHPQDYDTVYSFMFSFNEDKTWGVVKYKGGVGTWSDSVEESEIPLSEEDYSKLCLSYPEFGEYDQLIRLDRIPTVVRETILEVTDKEFPAFRQYLQRDIERYQEPKQ